MQPRSVAAPVSFISRLRATLASCPVSFGSAAIEAGALVQSHNLRSAYIPMDT